MPPGPPETQFERKSALEAPPRPPKNFKSARTRALRASKSVCERPRRARSPKPPRRSSVISRWMDLRMFSDVFGCFWRFLDVFGAFGTLKDVGLYRLWGVQVAGSPISVVDARPPTRCARVVWRRTVDHSTRRCLCLGVDHQLCSHPKPSLWWWWFAWCCSGLSAKGRRSLGKLLVEVGQQ